MPKNSKNTMYPYMPKRVKTAYFIWLQENIEQIKEPGMSVNDVTKAAGVKWSKMSANDKSIWVKKSADDKKRYDQQMELYRVLQRLTHEKGQLGSP